MTRGPETILVVDDDASHREMLVSVLRPEAERLLAAGSGEEALRILAGESVDLVFLDMRMPGMDGLETLAGMREQGHEVPTIVVTAFAEVEDAVQAIKLGARDYLRKPIDLQRLGELVERHMRPRPRTAAGEVEAAVPPGLVFESPLMQQVLRELRLVARNRAAVLLTGESGSGKEVLARLVHEWSGVEGALVSVNVAALPELLIESELFGHRKGAFTGADRERTGEFERAADGTLFLDEIGELPLALQPKLLRALESGRIRSLGSERETEIDFRLVCATNRDLEAEVEAGDFRKDLYYRLAVFTIEVPPLRDRVEDIVPLASALLESFEGEPKRLAAAAVGALQGHSWPGNVRELRNALQRAAIVAPGEWILPEHLPGTVQASEPSGVVRAGGARALAEIEREAILAALQRCDGNRTKAAQELGISRRKLHYRLKEYGVQ